MITTILAFTTFLGFNKRPTLMDLTNKFGNPISIEQNEEKTNQIFTYKRDGYVLVANCNKSGQTQSLEAYGMNPAVSYKKVKLLDEFKNVIVNIGDPTGYEFSGKEIIVKYSDCVFTITKLKKTYQVVGITVNME
jgi:hypothetical protein